MKVFFHRYTASELFTHSEATLKEMNFQIHYCREQKGLISSSRKEANSTPLNENSVSTLFFDILFKVERTGVHLFITTSRIPFKTGLISSELGVEDDFLRNLMLNLRSKTTTYKLDTPVTAYSLAL